MEIINVNPITHTPVFSYVVTGENERNGEVYQGLGVPHTIPGGNMLELKVQILESK